MTARGPRILEIGDRSLFARVWPAQTRACWTGHAARDVAGAPVEVLTPRKAPALARALRNGAFDLVACYPLEDPPWDPMRLWSLGRRYRARLAPLVVRALLPFVLLRGATVPVVALDLGDRTVISRHNRRLLDQARLYFKRELPVDRWRALDAPDRTRPLMARARQAPAALARLAKLRPISLGLTPQRLAAIAECGRPPKSIDVFFAGQLAASSTVRSDGLAQLEALRQRGYQVDVGPGDLSPAEFYARCARAWLAWSPEGYGWECFRHYEVAACGAVPLMNYPTVYRYAPLEDRVHALYYPPEAGALERVVVDALRDRERLAGMARAAAAHVQRHHTLERVCEYVLRCAGLEASPGAERP